MPLALCAGLLGLLGSTAVATEKAVGPCVAGLPAGTPVSCPAPAPAPAPKPAPRPDPRKDLTAYKGLGTWLDAYDWAPEYGGKTMPSALDAMKQRGVKTLYIQAAKESSRSRGAVLNPTRLGQWLTGAHARGIKVQAWYLPLLTDVAADNRHLDAITSFTAKGQRFDTIGLDIEWRGVKDVAERNRRLVAMTKRLRAKVPDRPLAGIVVAPVVTDDVNKDYWRPFPWAELKPYYDVWQPMGYWTNRKAGSRYRDAYESTRMNVRYLRRDLGGNVPVHVIGGIGATETEAKGFVRAAREEKALGGSLYDYPTTPSARYPTLRGLPK